MVGRWNWERDLIARAEPVRPGGTDVRVARAADLILLKLAAGGYLDQRDAAALLAVGQREEQVRDVERHLDEVRPDIRSAWHELLERTRE